MLGNLISIRKEVYLSMLEPGKHDLKTQIGSLDWSWPIPIRIGIGFADLRLDPTIQCKFYIITSVIGEPIRSRLD